MNIMIGSLNKTKADLMISNHKHNYHNITTKMKQKMLPRSWVVGGEVNDDSSSEEIRVSELKEDYSKLSWSRVGSLSKSN